MNERLVRARSLRSTVLAMSAALGLSACTGYGYSGVNVGYGSGGYYDSGYNSSPYFGSNYGGGYGGSYGWSGDYYYPGSGALVYDRGGRSYRWNQQQQRYWEGRRYALRDREDVRDFRNFRRDGRQDRQDFRTERGGDREQLRNGTITREQFRTDREADRLAYRGERRDDRRDFRRDLRDRPAAGVGLGGMNREDRQQRRAERRANRPR